MKHENVPEKADVAGNASPNRRDLLRWLFAPVALAPCAARMARGDEIAPSRCAAVAVSVTGLTKCGPHYEEVVRYLRFLEREWLCTPGADFFGGRRRVVQYVEDLLRYDLLAVGCIRQRGNAGMTINAFVSTCRSDVPDGMAAWVVNVRGSFFAGWRKGRKPSLELAYSRVLLLLHELGHALDAPGILPDLSNPAVSAANTRLVAERCAGTLQHVARWIRMPGSNGLI